ncbi:hypothetical protein VTI74DRAFT_117 [Chaetomium olivicolor]
MFSMSPKSWFLAGDTTNLKQYCVGVYYFRSTQPQLAHHLSQQYSVERWALQVSHSGKASTWVLEVCAPRKIRDSQDLNITQQCETLQNTNQTITDTNSRTMPVAMPPGYAIPQTMNSFRLTPVTPDEQKKRSVSRARIDKPRFQNRTEKTVTGEERRQNPRSKIH